MTSRFHNFSKHSNRPWECRHCGGAAAAPQHQLPPGMRVWVAFNKAGTEPLGYIRGYDKRYATTVARSHDESARVIAAKPAALFDLATTLRELHLPAVKR